MISPSSYCIKACFAFTSHICLHCVFTPSLTVVTSFSVQCHLEFQTCTLASLVLWYIPFCTCVSHLQTVCCFNPFRRLRETHVTCKNPGGVPGVVQQRWPSEQRADSIGCVCAPSSLGGPLATQSPGEDDQDLTPPDFSLKLLGQKEACFPFLINRVAEC